jgi:hypothetical protein
MSKNVHGARHVAQGKENTSPDAPDGVEKMTGK